MGPRSRDATQEVGLAFALSWRRRLSPLELGIYAGLVALVVAVFLDRALITLEIAERTTMEVTVANVNSALNIQLAAQILNGTPLERAGLARRNPFQLADMRVANLHPDLAQPEDLGRIQRGYWVFDPSRNELIYLPLRHRGLHTADSEAALRFRLQTADGRSYALVPVEEFSWQ